MMQLWRCTTLVLATAIGMMITPPVHAQDQTAPANAVFDTHFNATVARYKLPGLAVGVIRDGKVIYSRTSGELIAGSGKMIDEQTLFKIASNTKAMTGALLARLVDQGKLKWDDPVVKYLPDFRMNDPWVTRNMQVRDLLIHNSGLPAGAGDLMLWPEPNLFTRADVMQGLRWLKPSTSFRSRYAYDNTLYIVAGEVAAAASGAPYETLLRRELFEPLGMTRCQVGEWNRDAVGNVAQPHARRPEGNVPVREDAAVIPNSPMTAAGGVRCSLRDMLTWVSMWLEPERVGLVNGKPWLSEAQRRAVWTPQTIMSVSKLMRDWDNSHVSAYGYGWRMADVDGVWKVSHTGTLSGMYSAVTLLPDRRTGFVILINADADDARTVLNQTLVKQFTAPQLQRGIDHYAEALAKANAPTAPAHANAAAAARTPVMAKAMTAQLGRYIDPWLGEIRICPDAAGVRFSTLKSPKMTGKVLLSNARYMVKWDDPTMDTDAWLDFKPMVKGKATGLTMAKVDREADFSSDFEDLDFKRVGDCAH